MSGTLVGPDSADYAAAVRPSNSVTQQRPAWVAVITDPDDVTRVVEEVVTLTPPSGGFLEIVPQATGHGAGAPVGAGAVLVDTSRLASVVIDASSRTATVGAGATWRP